MSDRWAISRNGEDYHGSYDSFEEAKDVGLDDYGGDSFYVGKCRKPIQPEEYFTASDWLEHVSCQDEYSCDWAEDWDDSTKEQREELEKEVKAVMSAWLDRHKLRPSFYLIEEDVEIVSRPIDVAD